MSGQKGNDRASEIKKELAQLFSEQTAFFSKDVRTRQETEIADYEKRRERIRELFAEFCILANAA